MKISLLIILFFTLWGSKPLLQPKFQVEDVTGEVMILHREAKNGLVFESLTDIRMYSCDAFISIKRLQVESSLINLHVPCDKGYKPKPGEKLVPVYSKDNSGFKMYPPFSLLDQPKFYLVIEGLLPEEERHIRGLLKNFHYE